MSLIKNLWWLIKKRGKGVIKIKGDFFPDKIVCAQKWHGRFLVVCEHSLWEIEESHLGILTNRLLSKS